ncbi:MAG: aminotransferase class I/II-fold pyridoxal phosphate-dependent enzyme [Propionibacteriaceae bacterium]
MAALDEHLMNTRRRQEQRGIFRRLARLPEPEFVDLGSNDYLNLSHHENVIAAAHEALLCYGTSATGSRVVAGNLAVHEDLDLALTTLTGRHCLTFASGYAANLAAMTSLVSPTGCIILDAHAHASLVDGARLAGVPVLWAGHHDVDDVDRLLTHHGTPGSVVAVESIYSAGGDAAPLALLADVCARHDATLVVDEAHGIGVVNHGRGAAALLPQPHVIITGALGKACAAQGGFIGASPAVIDHLIASGRTFIYDTAITPAAAAAARAAIEIMLAEPDRIERLHQRAGTLAVAAGHVPPPGAIISIPVEGQELPHIEQRARDAHLTLGFFRPGSTPDGSFRVRATVHADMTTESLARACDFLNTVHPG